MNSMIASATAVKGDGFVFWMSNSMEEKSGICPRCMSGRKREVGSRNFKFSTGLKNDFGRSVSSGCSYFEFFPIPEILFYNVTFYP